MAGHDHHDHHDHAHSHGEGHKGHGHAHGPANYSWAFAIGIALNFSFVVAEATYGILSNSLALLADAGHNLGDVLGLMMAWTAAVLARRRPTARHTYGLRRGSILASLTNAALLLVAVGGIVWEAIQRLGTPEPIVGTTVIWVAAIGILINTATALMFMKGRKDDLNIKGAFTHMAADAVVSLGVVITGVAIMMTGWNWLDPVVSLAIALVIAIGTWSLLRDSLNLALDAVPENIDRHAVESYLAGLPGVREVHDLHIWPMSTTEVALTAHLVRPGAGLDDSLLAQACKEVHERFKIDHATFQVEAGDPNHPCRLAPAEVV